MWTILAATCGAIAGAAFGAAVTLVYSLDAMARREHQFQREIDEARAKLSRKNQRRVKGRWASSISPELDALLTEADEAAALDSAP